MTDPAELAARLTGELDERLAAADAALAAGFPGERPGRQPVHTVYVPADRYDAGLVPAYGAAALAGVDEHAAAFAELVADDDLVARVRAKLASEPVEDLRVDFEDGYVGKTDADEDADVVRAAPRAGRRASRRARRRRSAASGSSASRRRPGAAAIRTLTSYVATLVEAGGDARRLGGDAAQGDQRRPGRGDGARARETLDLRFEVQVETPQSILGPDGTALVARMVHAGGERLTGLHYGTYDYSAFCRDRRGVPVARAPGRRPRQAGHAGGGRRHRRPALRRLDQHAARRRRRRVAAAWANHHRLVRRSLEHGYYQGWDLHPAQLPTRYAATYAFYREGLARALTGSRRYTRAHRWAAIADEPATARPGGRYRASRGRATAAPCDDGRRCRRRAVRPRRGRRTLTSHLGVHHRRC